MANDLTSYALQGFNGQAVQALYSSPVHTAHALGEFFQATGRTAPRDVRMGRGDAIRANDMRFKVDYSRVKFPAFSRIE